jgi:hypothetical protein
MGKHGAVLDAIPAVPLKLLQNAGLRRMQPMFVANVAGAVTRTSGSPVQAAFCEIMSVRPSVVPPSRSQ